MRSMPDLHEPPSGGRQRGDFFRRRERANPAGRDRDGDVRRCPPHQTVPSPYTLWWGRINQPLGRWMLLASSAGRAPGCGTLTIPERRELEKRAAGERRSLSNYVARLVVGELERLA